MKLLEELLHAHRYFLTVGIPSKSIGEGVIFEGIPTIKIVANWWISGSAK